MPRFWLPVIAGLMMGFGGEGGTCKRGMLVCGFICVLLGYAGVWRGD